MSKFKVSTHALIDQTIQELLRPAIEVGKTYKLNGRGVDGKDAIVERTVIDIDKKNVTYLKFNKSITCPIATFQRIYALHGVRDGGSTE